LLSLEERLRPQVRGVSHTRDAFGIFLPAALMAVLLGAGGAGWRMDALDVAERVASFYLLAAMGFLLALRCGAIDLSVWANAAMGGLVAATLIKAGFSPWIAFGAGAGAGLLAGAVNGALVAGIGLPSVVVTAAVAVALMFLMRSLGGPLTISDQAFNGWLVTPHAPLVAVRILFVGAVYLLTMLVLMLGGVLATGRKAIHHRGSLLAALCVSGGLAGLAGACWLIDHSRAPVLTRPVGDLRIAVAAVLAGGAFLAGPGRILLAGAVLPVALLAAELWRQQVWDLQFKGFSLQLILLAGCAIVAQLAVARLAARVASPAPDKAGANGPGQRRPRRRLPAISAALTTAGILILAGAIVFDHYLTRRAFQFGGLGVWLVGAALLIACGRDKPSREPRVGEAPPG